MDPDPDPGSPKTYGSDGSESRSATLVGRAPSGYKVTRYGTIANLIIDVYSKPPELQ